MVLTSGTTKLLVAGQLVNKGQAKKLGKKVLDELQSLYRLEPSEPLDKFVQKLWQSWPFEDTTERTLEDYAHCYYGLWLSYQRALAEQSDASITIKAPCVEEEGWSCHGSVIHLVWPNSPFIVDTLRMTLNDLGINLRLLTSGVHTAISHDDESAELAVVYAELGLLTSSETDELKTRLYESLGELSLAVGDYYPLLEKMREWQQSYKNDKTPIFHEAAALLEWLEDSHFTYLGYREFSLKNGKAKLKPSSNLGIFRRDSIQPDETPAPADCVGDICGDALIFTKSPRMAKVHRAVYPDCIVMKQFNDAGEVVAEGHLLGFFTYAVSNAQPQSIPWVRDKIKTVNKASGLAQKTYGYRTLQRVIDGFPRDELLQASSEELTESLLGVCSLNERKQVRLFLRASPYGRFVTAIVYVPRDVYNTRVREKIEEILTAALGSEAVETTTFFSESVLARAYCVFKLPPNKNFDVRRDVDAADLQAEINMLATGWLERLQSALIEAHGEKKGLPLYRRYSRILSAGYQETYDARAAVGDIVLFEHAIASDDIAMHVFKPQGQADDRLRFKVVNVGGALALSDVIPILENLGVRVLGENPYCIPAPSDAKGNIWLHDFSLQMLYENVQVDAEFKQRFSETFSAAWHQRIDNDSFNRLTVAADIGWRDIFILRAYANYFKQTLFSIDLEGIAATLLNQPEIANQLLKAFYARFELSVADQEKAEILLQDIEHALENVKSLDEDRVIRRYLNIIRATLRTNAFQHTSSRTCSDTLVFKLAPKTIQDMPSPKPEFEIFVYSARMEGVHLRTSTVARGGLRWSDRFSDYRTEVLGLVKAQAVKNAVIVPSGAKGGFIGKKLAKFKDRQSYLAEGIACYQQFIRSLLSVTDNLVGGKIVKPKRVVCYDGDDPYLVVAADKGTATFSDIANEISLEFGHWLGDAFASGGSQGYDHKAMGITAKGGWVSVQRHFRERGINIQDESIKVVGIGDMAGDVFGNGMLLSRKIKLTAAFNHIHIFIDPNPDPEASFIERERLFTTSGTTWQDYDAKLISKGGGVFSRAAKSVTISAEMKQCFAITADKLTPTELISALLKAPVDLIWNGGIGTYVKAKHESHSEVGDKANDNLRVNGSELRCKVFGEGGNLGMTQRGRVEFCQAGGACNTDFIDNAAGVDCSDHEVNLKILLQSVIERGDLTEKQRNKHLKNYTDAVSDLVLGHNFAQTECLSIAQIQATKRASEYRKLISFLEKKSGLNRALEFLPEDHELVERFDKALPLTRPELAVLLSYAKVMLKEAIAETELFKETAIANMAYWAFPEQACNLFKKDIAKHRLLREIVSTQLANDFINNLGITAAYHFLSGSSATIEEVLRAYVISRDVFQLTEFNRYLKTLCNKLPQAVLYELKMKMARRVRRGVRWFMRKGGHQQDIKITIDNMRPTLEQIVASIDQALVGELKTEWQSHFEEYCNIGLDQKWVELLAMPDNLFAGLGVAAIQNETQRPTELCNRVFYGLHNLLNIRAFAGAVSEMPVASPWQAMARETLLEDIEIQLRIMAVAVVPNVDDQIPIADQLDELLPKPAVETWLQWLKDLSHEKEHADISLYNVSLRQLTAVTDAIVTANAKL